MKKIQVDKCIGVEFTSEIKIADWLSALKTTKRNLK